MEVEQKYSEIRRPVYARRGGIIKTIPDFWLTAVCALLYDQYFHVFMKCLLLCVVLIYCYMLQFLSHPLLSELLTEEDQKVSRHLMLTIDFINPSKFYEHSLGERTTIFEYF